MITVACVYKTDPDTSLSAEYVHRLEENVRAHTTRPFKFVCLTDADDVGCETIPLTEKLARQWSKLELFKPHFDGRVIYFDIDTIIVRNIDKLMDYAGDVAMLHCWKHEWKWASGIMAWNIPLPCVLPTPDERARIEVAPKRGDQKFISMKLARAGHEIDRVRDIVNAISYRWHVKGKGVPEDADIVCFHGGPRPHEIGWKL